MIARKSEELCSAQDLTASAAAAGDTIVAGVINADRINIIVKLDATGGTTVNVRIKLLGSDNFGNQTCIKATSVVLGATITVADTTTSYYELDLDSTHTIAFPYNLYKMWDKLDVQVWAGTVGDASDVTITYKLG